MSTERHQGLLKVMEEQLPVSTGLFCCHSKSRSQGLQQKTCWRLLENSGNPLCSMKKVTASLIVILITYFVLNCVIVICNCVTYYLLCFLKLLFTDLISLTCVSFVIADWDPAINRIASILQEIYVKENAVNKAFTVSQERQFTKASCLKDIRF